MTVELNGAGQAITELKNASAENIYNSVLEVVKNPQIYAKNAQKLSKYFKRHSKGEKVVKEWVDYAMDYGIDHLVVKPYYEMGTIQFYNIDVWSVLFAIFMGGLYLVFRMTIGCFNAHSQQKKIRKGGKIRISEDDME